MVSGAGIREKARQEPREKRAMRRRYREDFRGELPYVQSILQKEQDSIRTEKGKTGFAVYAIENYYPVGNNQSDID
jgi:hypothetical protein